MVREHMKIEEEKNSQDSVFKNESSQERNGSTNEKAKPNLTSGSSSSGALPNQQVITGPKTL